MGLQFLGPPLRQAIMTLYTFWSHKIWRKQPPCTQTFCIMNFFFYIIFCPFWTLLLWAITNLVISTDPVILSHCFYETSCYSFSAFSEEIRVFWYWWIKCVCRPSVSKKTSTMKKFFDDLWCHRLLQSWRQSQGNPGRKEQQIERCGRNTEGPLSAWFALHCHIPPL